MGIVDFIADMVPFGCADSIISQEFDVICRRAGTAGHIERIPADPDLRQTIFLDFFNKTFTDTHKRTSSQSSINNYYLLRSL